MAEVHLDRVYIQIPGIPGSCRPVCNLAPGFRVPCVPGTRGLGIAAARTIGERAFVAPCLALF